MRPARGGELSGAALSNADGVTPLGHDEPYRHLEDAEAVMWDLSLRQLAYVLSGAALAIVFGLYVSPLPAQWTLGVAIVLGGLPVVLSAVASGGELAPWTATQALWRWSRSPKFHVPGANPVVGYYVERESDPGREVSDRVPRIGPPAALEEVL